MTKAIWNGCILAESDDIVLVEGNAYFPRIDVDWGYVQLSYDIEPTYCHWKGVADYYDVFANGLESLGVAWCYPDTYDEAASIRHRVAFWKDVDIVDAPDGKGLVEQTPSLRGDKTGWKALCWYIKTTDKSVLSPEDVRENTNLSEAELSEAWLNYDVQRYAKKYKWELNVHLEKTA